MKSAPPLPPAPPPSLSILSIGWFHPDDVPPFFYPGVLSARDCEQSARFVLRPRDGSWSIFVHELQRVTPIRALGLQVPAVTTSPLSPLVNPYATGDLSAFVTFLEREARNHDLIVIGHCGGEGARRVRALPTWIRRKTILTHWDTVSAAEEREARAIETLEVISRAALVEWLVEHVQGLGETTFEVAKGLLSQLNPGAEVTPASKGTGLGA